jgi:alkylhydroperoxidase family enzyme
LSNEEMLRNRKGTSSDAKAAGTVAFARALNDQMGEVTTAEVDAARAAGLSDAEIVETIAVVALNIFTNLLNKATRVDIDFPPIELLGRASARRTA